MLHKAAEIRKKVGSKAAESMFKGLSITAVQTPPARRALKTLNIVRDLPYSNSGQKEHTLDLYIPRQSAAPMPVVFYVHGGGFRILSKDTHWLMGLGFAQKGYLTVNINYRLAPANPYPAAIHDVFEAWAWTLQNIHRFGGDPSRIVVAGESAGANLVTSLTLATCVEHAQPQARDTFQLGHTPQALIANCGILQVTDPERFLRKKKIPRIIYDRVEEVAVDYLKGALETQLADPLLTLENLEQPDRPLPPVFASGGTRDPLLDDTRRLKIALERLGTPHDVRIYHGEVHAFHAFLWRRQAIECWNDQFAFLNRVGL